MREFVQNRRIVGCKLSAPLLMMALICGCSGGITTSTGSAPTAASSILKGKMLGGQYPVTGATIQLYAVGSTGYGVGAEALLSPALTTDGNGAFNITSSDYTCPSDSALAYIVATGGDPGLGSNNPAIALMAPVGQCGQLSSIPYVVINEVTTVASAWALSPFLGSNATVGASSTNSQGLANAFASIGNMVDISNGTSPGTQAPAGATVPAAKIYALANILASCVNSAGGSTACNSLFSLATPPGGTAPANTLDAAVNIARNPSNHAASLFSLPVPQSPFESSLSTAPNDWTLAVSFDGGGLNYPTSLAVDASGNVWAANYCSSNSPCSSVSEFSNAGRPISPSGGFTDGTLWESYGLAIDSYGNVWVSNQQTTGVNAGNGSVSELNPAGQVVSPAGGYYAGDVYFPVAVAADTDGSIWTANQGNSTASELENSGSPISGSDGFGAGQLSGPSAVALDANQNAWFANQYAASGSVTSISSDGSQVQEMASGGYQPSGVATDAIGLSAGTSKGHVWVANFSTDSLSVPGSVSELQLNNDGTATVVSTGYTGGGIDHPNGIAVDGSGTVWVTNYKGNTLTVLEGANGTNPGNALSPAAGLGADADLRVPYGIAIDTSGDVWVSNLGSSTLTEFIGAAAPAKTPLIGPAQLP